MESVKRETSKKCKRVLREQKSDGVSDGAFVSWFCVLVREAHKRKPTSFFFFSVKPTPLNSGT